MKIGRLDTGEKVITIAEIGNNHEGSYSLAEEMIGQAAAAGADAVKFQTIIPNRLVPGNQTDRIAQLKRLCLPLEAFEKLSRVAEAEGIVFLSTPFDLESAAFLEALVPAYKIASGDNRFFPLIGKIADTGKPIIISSGLAAYDEIAAVRDFIYGVWDRRGIQSDLAVLHCVASYPTLPAEANLSFINRLKKLGCTVGYSDHTIGIEAAVLASAMGARIIEKHFTIDKNYSDFRDHQLSADPDDFARLVERVEEAQTYIGDDGNDVSRSELESVVAYRRSIAAAYDLPAGTIIEPKHITWLRPGNGLCPGQEDRVLGRQLAKNLGSGEMILPENFT